MTIYDLVDKHDTERPALLAPGRPPLTYGELRLRLERAIGAFRERGLGPDSRIAVVLPEGPDLAFAVLATAAGAVCAPLNPAYRRAELEFYLEDLQADALIAPADSEAAEVAGEKKVPLLQLEGSEPVRPQKDPESVALLLHTSGSTARPKLVSLTQANLCSAAENIRMALELSPEDRSLTVMPLFHIHGLSTVLSSLAAGGSFVCPGAFSPEGFFAATEEFAPTWYSAAPTIHHVVLQTARSYKGFRFLRSASAPMPPDLIADLERTFQAPFLEAYGMTEAAPQIASNRVGECRPGSVGRPAGPEVAIWDEEGFELPPGQPGEIVVRGANVAAPGWLRTGDLGYLDGEGFLFVTGRVKEIINRGGEKISPREVDEVLLQHPAVSQAVTFAVPHPVLGENVGAAVVATSGTRAEDLRDFAAERLAHFKVPQHLVFLDSLPLGSTGKVQRIGLAQKLAVEARLSEIFAEVLEVAIPGRDDNFFSLGGHSLTATRALARVNSEFGLDLPMETLFRRPTVAGLAELVQSSKDKPGPAPLSFTQQRLWFLDSLESGHSAYTMSVSLRLHGPLDESALERALNEVRRRHDSLRTTFHLVGDEPVQVVAPAKPTQLPVVDLTGFPAADAEAEARRLATEEATRPFALTRGPLFRTTLVRLGTEEHLLLLTMHHIISDGWSTRVLHRELAALYRAFAAGRPSPLPELPMQYADFALWQRRQPLEAQLAYWKKRLSPEPAALELPTDRPRPPVQTYRGARHAFSLPAELVERLRSLGGERGATLYMTILAALKALLSRYCGAEDVAVGTPIANRTRVETEQLIGFFANTLVMRTDLSGDPSCLELLERVSRTAQEAYAHQDAPFERVVEEVAPRRDAGRTPLFQVMFAFQNLPGSEGDLDGAPFELAPGLVARPFKVDAHSAKFDLTLYLTESGRGVWQYNTDLFEARSIERLDTHFRSLLAGFATDPTQPVSKLPLLDEAERHRLLLEWNRTEQDYATAEPFYRQFEERVRERPQAPAVVCGGERLSYAELNARADQLAGELRELGVGPGTLVGLRLERSVEVIVAVLATLKAGATYLPLDPDYPPERLSFMIEDARVKVLITEEGPELQQDASAVPDDLAYVIYTSGSTGRPKGVMLTQANLSHYVQALRQAVGIERGDRYLHTASFSFSSSVRQLAVPLAAGACVVIAPKDQVRDPRALFQLVVEEGVTVIDLVPSHWRSCVQALQYLDPAERVNLQGSALRLVLSASEPLTPDVPLDWTRWFGTGARLMNMFGQTETTGIVTVHPVPGSRTDPGCVVPIGRPISNTRIYLLDENRQPVPVGLRGELYVGGAGVGRGYLNQPELTRERFVEDPFVPGDLLYRTGDLARYRPDGTLEFFGRDDDQIKVRGFRVEPGEVEAALLRHPDVVRAAVVASQQRLAAFVVCKEKQPDLRGYLKEKLPEYMVPSAIVPVKDLPLTPTGKLDRRALLTRLEAAPHAPEPRPTVRSRFRAPRTGTEQALARVWQEVLKVDRVGLDDNFFDLGGDSILSVQVALAARRAGLDLDLRQLFRYQTVGELAGAMGPRDVAVIEDHEPVVRVPVDRLRALGRAILEEAGLDPEGAAVVAEVQLESSLRNQPTHNICDLPRYARRLVEGVLNSSPHIRVEHETRVSARIDGDNGPGQWVASVAMEKAIEKAGRSGIGLVGVRRSNHFGAAGHYAWMAATRNLIGLCTTNGPLILAPTGGVTPTFGNNPLAVGIPAAERHPVLLDIAMSVAPRGKIGLHVAQGKPLPEGWILDRHGRPSTDLADLAAGLGVPIGAHKGYGLALVMEVLAGALTGAGFGLDHAREKTDFGHFFMALDPELFMPAAEFKARVNVLIEQAKTGRRAVGCEEILVPGEAELRAREENLRLGVPLPVSRYEALMTYARTVGLDGAVPT